MNAVYEGNKLRMLIVLAYLKVCHGKQSYCSFKEYAKSIKWGRNYKLVDGGMVAYINRI